MHVTEQPAFLNAAALISTQLSPGGLLDTVKAAEAQAGRSHAGQRWGPRPLDLDIAFFGTLQQRTERLTIPHERWRQRPFVHVPIRDLAHSDAEDAHLQVCCM
jgi:2-amino-4-hydroxy-6-hydroxymethyldihydropteridine diphosphokinase